MTSIDLNGLDKLEHLLFYDNKVEEIKLDSKLPSLKTIWGFRNNLKKFDSSKFPSLETLDLSENSIGE